MSKKRKKSDKQLSDEYLQNVAPDTGSDPPETDEDKPPASIRLAQALMLFDEDNPGEHDADMEVPAETWAEWIDLAGQIERENETKGGSS